MKKKNLIKEQVELFLEVQKQGINIVTCGNCGTVILHKTDKEGDIDCFGCGLTMEKSDCPDLWYE